MQQKAMQQLNEVQEQDVGKQRKQGDAQVAQDRSDSNDCSDKQMPKAPMAEAESSSGNKNENTIEAAKEYILEQFDDLIASTTDDETGQVMVEEEGWYENFILDKYEIRQMEVTLN